MFKLMTMLELSAGFQWCVRAAVLPVVALLAGCGTSDDKMASYMVSPDKFALYDCAQLSEQAVKTGAREKELAALMVRAGPSADGRLVSSVAYRPEYLIARGDMIELRNAAVAKKCEFVPGAEKAAAPVNGRFIR